MSNHEGIIKESRSKKPIWRPPEKNDDNEWIRRPAPETEAEKKVGKWVDAELAETEKDSPRKSAKEFTDRVSYESFMQLQIYAERLAKIRSDFGVSSPREKVFFDADLPRKRYRQFALNFLQNYADQIDMLRADGINPEGFIDFRDKLNISTEKLITFAAGIINNTMDLEDQLPSSGLEHFLKGKNSASKKIAA